VIQAPASADALLLVGLSSTTWAGFALPLDLSPMGLPGCYLNVSLDAIVPARVSDPPFATSAAAGLAHIALPVPPLPGLGGVRIVFQWYLDSPAPTGIPGLLSRGLEVTLQ
jgi:hypothetical protein